MYIYIYGTPPPPVPRSALRFKSMNTKTWVPEGGGPQWKMLVLPTFPTISMTLKTMAPAFQVSRKSPFTNIFYDFPQTNLGLANISNNFHDFSNYGSGCRGLSTFMEIVGFTNIFREQIMENVGFTNISNNFHDCPNYGTGSRGFSKIMEIVGIVGFTNIFREHVMENVGFTNNFP